MRLYWPEHEKRKTEALPGMRQGGGRASGIASSVSTWMPDFSSRRGELREQMPEVAVVADQGDARFRFLARA